MDEDKNNINTRSLDDLSNLDTNKTSENNKPFHDVSSNLDNDDFINFDEEDKNDVDEDKTDDIFANLNLYRFYQPWLTGFTSGIRLAGDAYRTRRAGVLYGDCIYGYLRRNNYLKSSF